uniref:Large subunit GTPase 1 homolog n=1 Tax=Electrophorus electricus TaxID=8005 RepID=A0A4W4FGR6_ELEEL
MGKKKKGLGRALIKERNRTGHGGRGHDTWLHTSELNDGYDWGRLNLQSVTEQSALEDFLATAELAGTEFIAEKLNVRFVPAEARTGLLTAEESKRLKKLHRENRQFLRIPRRPPWDEHTSSEDLQQAERDNFLTWRRDLARLEEEQKLILTPFERNLDFWRQLWRVIERSDVVVQIVDARNPLLFRCPDLEKYVKEVSSHKVNMLLLNKADLLTREQRRAWARYFQKEGMRAVFWSALTEAQRLERHEEENETRSGDCSSEADWQTCSEASGDEAELEDEGSSDRASFHNSSRLLRKDELLEVFKSAQSGPKCKEGQLTAGLVGYPNVGKSSTINTILRNKKVSVSATPGHTKHFQTLFVEPGLCLCDCPGLVMPSFLSTKAEMICNGILPIDQMRDHVPAGIYGINIIKPREDDDPDRPPTAEELLTAYGYMRGFMTAHGQPDQSRSARYVLKDYVSGKLLYCHPPPHINADQFQTQHSKFTKWPVQEQPSSRNNRASKVKRIENSVDKNFFHQENVRALTKGVQLVMGYQPGSGRQDQGPSAPEKQAGKPWKKHGNRNKKEKVRRLYKHLDA